MTKDQAIALYDSKFWEEMTYEQRARFQLFEERLCMPFGVFHEAVEKALGRSVWTHEFGLNSDGLRRELLGETAAAPSMQEIIDLIPAEKRIIIVQP
jgi:hypothetical protein